MILLGKVWGNVCRIIPSIKNRFRSIIRIVEYCGRFCEAFRTPARDDAGHGRLGRRPKGVRERTRELAVVTVPRAMAI